MRSRCNRNDDNGLLVNRVRLYVRNELRFAGVGYGVGDAVHCLEKGGFVHPDNLSRLVGYANNQLPALRVGKGDYRFRIFFRIRRKNLLELDIFRFPSNHIFYLHRKASSTVFTH